MTLQEFQTEIARLEDQWPNSYGTERKKVLFRSFTKTNAETFRDAVTLCLSRERSAPLVPELEKAAIEVRRTDYEQRRTGNPLRLLQEAAEKTPNKEYARACVKIIEDYYYHRINKAQFDQGCDFLDQAAKQLSPRICVDCNGAGYVTPKGHLMRCGCAVGRAMPETLSGKEEIKIPAWEKYSNS